MSLLAEPATAITPVARSAMAAPLVAVDEIELLESTATGAELLGRKRVRPDDPYLIGHYPGFPIYPGIFSIETVLQTARGFLAGQDPADAAVVITGIESVSFSAPLVPGDELTARCTVTRSRDATGRDCWLVKAVCSRTDGSRSARMKLVLGAAPDGAGADAVVADAPGTTAPGMPVPVPAATLMRPLGLATVLATLPHRHPIVQIDRVVSLEPGVRIVAQRAVSGSEPCYAGLDHRTLQEGFSYPASLLVESLGQAGGLLWLLSQQAETGGQPAAGDAMLIFGSARDLTIHGSAYPGDVLTHEVVIESIKGDNAFLSGRSWAGDRLIATTGSILAVLRSAEALGG